MSDDTSAGFVHVVPPICTCNNPKYTSCIKHFPPPPARAYIVKDGVSIELGNSQPAMTTPPTGRDEMPEAVPKDLFCPIWVGCAIVNARIEIRDRGDDAGEAGALVWCADALGSEGRKIKSLRSALEKAEWERDEAQMALLTGKDDAVLRRMLDDGINALNEKRLSLFERAYPGGVPTQSLRPAIKLILRTIVHHIPDIEVVK